MNVRPLRCGAVTVLLLGLNCLLACHPRGPAQEDFFSPDGRPNCFLEGFTEADPEGFIEQVAEPFIVRKIQGKILGPEGDAIWVKDHPPLLEIRAFDAMIEKPKGVYADKDGVFKMEGVPDGPYCFKATMDGWRSVMGIIVVSKKADPKSSITLRLLPGN